MFSLLTWKCEDVDPCTGPLKHNATARSNDNCVVAGLCPAAAGTERRPPAPASSRTAKCCRPPSAPGPGQTRSASMEAHHLSQGEAGSPVGEIPGTLIRVPIAGGFAAVALQHTYGIYYYRQIFLWFYEMLLAFIVSLG